MYHIWPVQDTLHFQKKGNSCYSEWEALAETELSCVTVTIGRVLKVPHGASLKAWDRFHIVLLK